jgi:hypothetical protein
MRYSYILFFSILISTSCEKTVEAVPDGPFDVYPNPFAGYFSLYVKDGIPASATIGLSVTDGSDVPVVKLDGLQPAQNLTINMAEKKAGVYYVELSIDDELFTQPILKID